MPFKYTQKEIITKTNKPETTSSQSNKKPSFRQRVSIFWFLGSDYKKRCTLKKNLTNNITDTLNIKKLHLTLLRIFP